MVRSRLHALSLHTQCFPFVGPQAYTLYDTALFLLNMNAKNTAEVSRPGCWAMAGMLMVGVDNTHVRTHTSPCAAGALLCGQRSLLRWRRLVPGTVEWQLGGDEPDRDAGDLMPCTQLTSTTVWVV